MFTKGKSGNPGGRPKGLKHVREMAQKWTPRAISVLSTALKSADERVRVHAATALLDRGWGKPAQQIEGADGKSLVLELRIGSEEKLALAGNALTDRNRISNAPINGNGARAGVTSAK